MAEKEFVKCLVARGWNGPAAAEVVGKDSGTELMQTCMHFTDCEKDYVLAQNSESKGKVLVVIPVSLTTLVFYISNISEECKPRASVTIER